MSIDFVQGFSIIENDFTFYSSGTIVIAFNSVYLIYNTGLTANCSQL